MERGAGAKLLLLWATCFGHAQADELSGHTSVIEVTNGGPWGDWAWPEMCPDGFFASGFSLKVRAQTCLKGDGDAQDPRTEDGSLLTRPYPSYPRCPGGAPTRHFWRRHGNERDPAALRAGACGTQHSRGGVSVWKVRGRGQGSLRVGVCPLPSVTPTHSQLAGPSRAVGQFRPGE